MTVCGLPSACRVKLPPDLTGRTAGVISVGAAIALVIGAAVGMAVPRVQLLLPVLIAAVLVSGPLAWHLSERADHALDRKVIAALVVGYAGLAVLIAATEYFVSQALTLQTIQRP